MYKIRTQTPTKNEWCTPTWLIDYVENKLQMDFDLDACANETNKICESYLWDCMVLPWVGKNVWCNPPYSPLKLRKQIFARGLDQINKGICSHITWLLGPADPSTVFLKTVSDHCYALDFLCPRVEFINGIDPERKNSEPSFGVYLAYMSQESALKKNKCKINIVDINKSVSRIDTDEQEFRAATIS